MLEILPRYFEIISFKKHSVLLCLIGLGHQTTIQYDVIVSTT